MIVCFDIGSTLIDGPAIGPVRRIAEALDLAPQRLAGLNELLFATDPKTPAGLADLLVARCGAAPRRALEAASAIWRAQAEEAYVLPGARAALERMRNAGIPMAFVSNIWAPFHEGFRRCLPEFAEAYPGFLSFRMGAAKPDADIYLRALEALGVSPNAAVMVGDTYRNDILPALNLGMKTVWLLHRPDKERADLVQALNGDAPRPDLTLASVGDLRPEHITDLLEPG
jgi:HAD superfamily hydrolase (TIGR01509 family)